MEPFFINNIEIILPSSNFWFILNQQVLKSIRELDFSLCKLFTVYLLLPTSLTKHCIVNTKTIFCSKYYRPNQLLYLYSALVFVMAMGGFFLISSHFVSNL